MAGSDRVVLTSAWSGPVSSLGSDVGVVSAYELTWCSGYGLTCRWVFGELIVPGPRWGSPSGSSTSKETIPKGDPCMILSPEDWMNIRRFRVLHDTGSSYAEIARECGVDPRVNAP